MKIEDYLRFVVDRFDHYYDSANNKSSLYIALNTFILGGIVAAYSSLQSHVEFSGSILILSVVLFLFCFLSIYFTIRSMMPFLQHGKFDNDKTSLLYFGGIARHAFTDYKSRVARLNESLIEEDLINQTHCLATGLRNKYRRLQVAGVFLFLQFTVLLPLLVLIFKNFKP